MEVFVRTVFAWLFIGVPLICVTHIGLTICLIIVLYGLRRWFKYHRPGQELNTISFTIWLICLIIFVCGGYRVFMEQWKWRQALKWNDEEKIVEYDHIVTSKGRKLTLEKTKIVRIPQTVYDNMSKFPDKKEHFLGKKKQVIVVTSGPDDCPYWNGFKQKVQEVFQDEKIRKDYTFNLYGYSMCDLKSLPYSDDDTVEEIRKAHQHPCGWIDAHCNLSMCIINPQTREAVIYVRQQPEHVLPLLKEYASWDKEPLLK